MSSPDHWKSRTLLVVAAAIVGALIFVPYGYIAVYPFRLFGTFIHEAGHALAAVTTGGTVKSLVVNLDTSGYVKSAGGFRPLVASAGYLGSVVVGAALLFAGRRREWARPTLLTLGVATLVVTAVFAGYGGAFGSLVAFGLFAAGLGLFALGQHRADRGKNQKKFVVFGTLVLVGALGVATALGGLLTWIIGLGIGGAAVFVGLYGSRLVQHLTVLFLGVQISLDGLNSIQTLWHVTTDGHGHNDAANMAEVTGLPAEFWALFWGGLSLMVIGAAFWQFWRSEKKPTP